MHGTVMRRSGCGLEAGVIYILRQKRGAGIAAVSQVKVSQRMGRWFLISGKRMRTEMFYQNLHYRKKLIM